VKKALLLFSGGLDSLIVALLFKREGVPFSAVYFDTPFFHSLENIRSLAHMHDIPLIVVDFWEDMQYIIKHPRWGYGRALNPCADCHFTMIKRAFEIMNAFGADFVVTGEVLGERPMSQRGEILESHMRLLGGFADLLLRPLSAKLLPPTRPVREGWVPESVLFDFRGRKRAHLIELARILGAKFIPSPAGGCLLTEPVFARKLCLVMRFLENVPRDVVKVLTVGRHLWRERDKVLLVVARNREESEFLKLWRPNGWLLIEGIETGPVAIAVSFDRNSGADELAAVASFFSGKLRMAGKAKYKVDGVEVDVVPTEPGALGFLNLSQHEVFCHLKGREL